MAIEFILFVCLIPSVTCESQLCSRPPACESSHFPASIGANRSCLVLREEECKTAVTEVFNDDGSVDDSSTCHYNQLTVSLDTVIVRNTLHYPYIRFMPSITVLDPVHCIHENVPVYCAHTDAQDRPVGHTTICRLFNLTSWEQVDVFPVQLRTGCFGPVPDVAQFQFTVQLHPQLCVARAVVVFPHPCHAEGAKSYNSTLRPTEPVSWRYYRPSLLIDNETDPFGVWVRVPGAPEGLVARSIRVILTNLATGQAMFGQINKNSRGYRFTNIQKGSYKIQAQTLHPDCPKSACDGITAYFVSTEGHYVAVRQILVPSKSHMQEQRSTRTRSFHTTRGAGTNWIRKRCSRKSLDCSSGKR